MYVHSRCSAWGGRGLKVCVLHTERTLTKQWHGGSRWNLLDSSLWDRKRGQACAQPLVAPHPARTQISFLEPTVTGNGWWLRHCQVEFIWPGHFLLPFKS